MHSKSISSHKEAEVEEEKKKEEGGGGGGGAQWGKTETVGRSLELYSEWQ